MLMLGGTYAGPWRPFFIMSEKILLTEVINLKSYTIENYIDGKLYSVETFTKETFPIIFIDRVHPEKVPVTVIRKVEKDK